MKNVRFLALGLLVPLAACSDVLSLDVESPGRINDADLNTADAIPGLVAGMSYDLTQAVDGTLQELSLASGDIWHSGSYDFGTYPRGILLQAPEDWDGEYGSMQQARWVAENGLKRIAAFYAPAEFERDPDVARGYLLAGFANRLLGETQCSSTVDGGPEVPRTEHFNRADSLFSRAIAIGNAAGVSRVVEAAYGGRASIRAWLGNWAQAVNDAQQVSAGFEYSAVFSTVSGAVANDLADETIDRREFTVLNTVWADNDPNDPRVPWRISLDNAGQVEKGQDGETDFYQQLKYLNEDADVRLTHGSEMLVLRAESALRDGNLGPMTDLLNQARAVYGVDPIAQPATVAEAWPVLRMERAAVLWLEGRRLYDLHRWEVAGGVQADPFSQGRDTCFPISDEERRVNANIG
jgi:hypothetical protein